MNCKNIDEVQKEIIASIFKEPSQIDEGSPPCPVLEKFKKVKPETLRIIFGKLGLIFSDFLKAVDPDHPHTNSILNEIFADRDFLLDVSELLMLTDYAISNSLTRMLPSIVDKFLKYRRQNLMKALKVRLIKSGKVREITRRKKKAQNVSLKNVLKRTEEIVDAPLDFNDFVRFFNPRQAEIEEAQKKAKRFEELGCIKLAEKTVGFLDSLNLKDNVYYGFNRITMTHAAIILAKQHDFDFKEYKPKAFPYYQLQAMAPTHVKEIIAHLEKFPDIGGKAAFDHFVVLVPSVKSSHSHAILLGEVTPILLGEKDGKCYFICYWL